MSTIIEECQQTHGDGGGDGLWICLLHCGKERACLGSLHVRFIGRGPICRLFLHRLGSSSASSNFVRIHCDHCDHSPLAHEPTSLPYPTPPCSQPPATPPPTRTPPSTEFLTTPPTNLPPPPHPPSEVLRGNRRESSSRCTHTAYRDAYNGWERHPFPA